MIELPLDGSQTVAPDELPKVFRRGDRWTIANMDPTLDKEYSRLKLDASASGKACWFGELECDYVGLLLLSSRQSSSLQVLFLILSDCTTMVTVVLCPFFHFSLLSLDDNKAAQL